MLPPAYCTPARLSPAIAAGVRMRTKGAITSAIKPAIKRTIKLKSYCIYNKQHFVVATRTTKMIMRAAALQLCKADMSTVKMLFVVAAITFKF